MYGVNIEEDLVFFVEFCLRELINRVSYGNIKLIVNFVFIYFDKSDFWVLNDFVLKVFKVVLYLV